MGEKEVRRAARLDTTHKPIQEAFRRLGCSVLSLAQVGSGCPDLLVACGVVACLVECKTPKRGTKKGTAERQAEFRVTWQGWTEIARDMGDVARIVGRMRDIHRGTA